ncbi:hypothetical protein BDW02DRAFT_574674 [Decorospora gaudefroyi]|uniref:Uncharacterized protein n=1 Tax=Decorospora gaudefroyi TaxID=184978 RepID=A0A6A5JW19_9PLEO|nr:hypothetical protein BDW02DRAFT_574674 [Decorospora gaudefroyi]
MLSVWSRVVIAVFFFVGYPGAGGTVTGISAYELSSGYGVVLARGIDGSCAVVGQGGEDERLGDVVETWAIVAKVPTRPRRVSSQIATKSAFMLGLEWTEKHQ